MFRAEDDNNSTTTLYNQGMCNSISECTTLSHINRTSFVPLMMSFDTLVNINKDVV